MKKINEARGHAITEARRAKSMSQRDLALGMRVHVNTISRWERGGRIGLRHIVRLADALDLPATSLV